MAKAQSLPCSEDIQLKFDLALDGHELKKEPTEDMQADLKAILDELGLTDRKVDGLGQFFKLADARVEALRAEARSCQARARSIEGSVKWLKTEYLRRMDAAGKPKIKGAIHTIYVQEKPTAVVEDRDALTEEYIRVKHEEEPNLEVILQHMQEGVEVPGCLLGSTRYIVVR